MIFPSLEKRGQGRFDFFVKPLKYITDQKKPDVLPRSLYGNQLIASAATMHYVHGIPMGRIESILGNKINAGSLFDTLHRVAGIWKPAIEKLIKD